MAAKDMQEMISEMRAEFWTILMSDPREDEIKEFLKSKLEMFAGEFEEQTLTENLIEVYGDYLGTLVLEMEAGA